MKMIPELRDKDVDKCCRTCLNDISNIFYDLFAKYENTTSLAEMLLICTSILVQEEDKLPKKLCGTCYNCLVSFYDFKIRAEKVEDELKNSHNRLVKLEPIIETEKPFHIKVGVETVYQNQDEKFSDNFADDLYDPEVVIENKHPEMVLDNNDLICSNVLQVKRENCYEEEILVKKNNYKCNTCDRKFRTLSKLQIHEEKHNRRVYSCNFCPEKFVYKYKLIKHLMQHSQKKDDLLFLEINQNEISQNLECDICSASFKSVQSLSAHMRVHVEKGRVLSCSLCGKVFKKVSHLKRHELSHGANRPFKCTTCPKSFTTKDLLNDHTNRRHGINDNHHNLMNVHVQKSQPHECPFCSKSFCNICNFSTHLKVHTKGKIYQHSQKEKNEISQNLECDICSASFKSVHSLSAHMRVHVEKGRVLSCSLCGKVFKKSSHLKRHELSHEVNRPFKCTTCPKSFFTEVLLNDHTNRHHGIKPHECPLCSKSFSNISGLTTHLKVHTEGRIYLCSTCGKKFDTSTNLNQHMKRHIGLKLFACNLCPRSFITKGGLKSHSRTHTGEKAYTCDQCGASLTTQSSLAKHKLRHTGVRPHQCEICSRKFSNKDHLKRHYRIHTGEKPYRCEICERAFTQSNDLVKHRRAHLGDKLYRCTQCSESFRLQNELRHHISEHYISSGLQEMNMNGSSQTDPKNYVKGQETLDNKTSSDENKNAETPNN